MCFPMGSALFPVFSDALPEQMISAVAVMDNLSQIALGLANGAVMVLMPGMAHLQLLTQGQRFEKNSAPC